MLDVVQIMRRPQGGNNFSVEGLFSAVRAALPADIGTEVAVAPGPSRGIVKRLGNIAWAARFRSRPVVHVTGDILYVAAALGPRTVITVLDLGWAPMGTAARKVFETVWLRIPTRRARIVTTISAFTREQLIARIQCPPEKVRVVPCCYDPAFTPDPDKPVGDPPVILTVGTTANKNIERLAAAIGGLDATLHIVGPLLQSQRSALEQHRIRFRNSVAISMDALVAAYREADVVAFPSIYEGFGLPIIEGQATGRPVVTSNVASMPEVAGGAACLVDPLDVSSIREGIVRVLGDNTYRADLRARGFENVKRFSAQRVAQQYAAVYREVAA